MVAVVAVPLSRAGEAGGALSKPEAALQGTWESKSGWQLVFQDRTFSAKSDSGWYRGSFSAPATDEDPAPLDIKIEDCDCKYKGLVSKSIYRWNGEALLLAGTTPGEPRPHVFSDEQGLLLDMTRAVTAKLP